MKNGRKKLKRLEKENAEKMDTLVVNLIQERSDSNITRLKTRLIARETRIKQLEEELDIARIDGETIAISRTVEEDLRNQIDVLTQELEDSKKHHTPVSLYTSSFKLLINFFIGNASFQYFTCKNLSFRKQVSYIIKI